MSIKVGEMNTLSVLRETPVSFLLTDGIEEIFLHKAQASRPLESAEVVDVFLYYDNQKRITATMNVPVLNQSKPAFVKVVGVHRKLGVFLDIGLKKDLLLSIDDLPPMRNEWPEVGDTLFVKMKASANQLSAKRVNRFDVSMYLKPENVLAENDVVQAYKIYQAEEGAVFLTTEGHRIFVYGKHMRKTYRLGELTEIKITIVKESDYNGTMIEQKELMLDKDAEVILDYLKRSQGSMPFTDKTNPNEIKDIFHMSKSAFKRALGTLYKQERVILKKDETVLKDVE